MIDPSTSNATFKDHPQVCRSGFTLIELLVVIAVLALLLSLLAPLGANTIEYAKKTNCSSNMRQIGVALLAYASDHDGDFPTTYSPAFNSHGFVNKPHHSWDDNLGSYDGRDLSESDKDENLLRPSAGYTSGIYKCPSDTTKRLYGSDPDALAISYSLSDYKDADNRSQGVTGLDWTATPRDTKSLRHSNIARPSRSIAMLELTWPGKNLGRYWGSHSNARSQLDSPAFIPHKSLGGSNYLMIDGHVETLTFDETLKKADGSSASPNDITGTMWDTIGK